MAAFSQPVGRTLSHYEILGEAGVGGMGIVYRARDLRLDRIVALKVLPPGALLDENARKRFRHEALALAKLNHAHIATIHDFDTHDGVDFLVMEYVEGASLADTLSKGHLPEKKAVALGRQVAETLEYAHEHGIIHRDLKPGNIMVTPQGQVKLLDFGLARLVQGTEAALTESVGEVKKAAGTLPYMAPEQLRGQSGDPRIDIYAAGAMLYEMVTGQRPFPQRHVPELVTAILHEEPVPPSELSADVSHTLQTIILKALDKDPDRRYQSAKELRVDLERMDLPNSGRIIPPHPQRHSYLRTILVLVPIFLAISAMWFVNFWKNNPKGSAEPRQVLVADFENRTGDADFDDSLSTALSTYLEQSNAVIIFPAARQRAGMQTLGGTAGSRVDANMGSKICVREGIPLLITGEISRFKDQYLLAVRVLNPADQKVLSVHSAQAREKNAVLTTLGTVAREARLAIGEQRLSVEKNDKLPEQVTTTSLPALQLYSLARKEHLDGNYEAAAALYRDAIRLDPNFALAYVRLSTVYRNLGDIANTRSNMDKAIGLIDHVTDRERYTLLGVRAAYDEDFEEAIDNFLVLTKLYPKDATGHFYLALSYFLDRKFDVALTEARKSTALDPTPLANTNLAEILLAQNRFQEVIDLVQANPPLAREGALVLAYLGTDQVPNAEKEVDRMFAIQDEQAHAQAAEARLQTLLFTGHWKNAEKFLEETPTVGKDRFSVRSLALAALALQHGNQPKAGLLLRKLQPKLPLSDSQYGSLAVLSAEAHEPEIARKVLHEVEAQLPVRGNRRRHAYANLLRGELALAEGQPKQALPFLKSARTDWDDIVVRNAYAQALFECGSWTEAATEFKEIHKLKGQALKKTEALVLWKNSPYWIARSLQAQGDSAGSRQAYQQFLEAWPTGEQSWPTTQDAQRRLSRLR
jgi:serine/threonine protein kinase/tetratricopeptide (TPR) repeat protein